MSTKTLFPSDQFGRKNTPKTKKPQYLVLGFDTEYQRVSAPNEEGVVETENQVLSYQFSCLIVTPDNADAELQWSGIVLPKGRQQSDRMSLTEFVSYALAAGFRTHPDMVVPSDVYLVAHFTRADVPGFSDFKDDESRAALNLDNIRNLFMNVSSDIGIKLPCRGTKSSVRLNVQIRDTIALAPAGAKSLAQLGEILGFEKLKLSDDPRQDLFFKTHMADFMEANWCLFREYAIRDAEICAQYTTRLIRLYFDQTGAFKLPVTLTSIGVDLIRKHWEKIGLDPSGVVGKEKVVESKWDKKKERYVKATKVVSIPKLHWSEDFLTECYHGGRNEQFWFGPAPEGIWYDYDLASAYPSAMALIGEVYWETIRPLKSTEELLSNRFFPTDMVFANVNFEFPDHVRFPVLPVRTETGLLFPRKGNSSTHISEIMLAHRLGCKIELVEGRHIVSDNVLSRIRYGEPPKRPFLGFTKHCINERKKHPKKSLNNLFWKELVNSTYGKTAQGLRERRIYDLRSAQTKPLEPSKITNPVYAAFITAFCRAVLSEIMNELPESVQIFSVTTDGFLTDATDAQMRKASFKTLGYEYNGARRVLAREWLIYEVKHIIHQPLGWRTRGQATLKPSQEKDFDGIDLAPKVDERIVLAKGGIKLNRVLSKAEQNDEIVNLFLNRKPTDTMAALQGAGIREMYEQGMDFVDKRVTKRLSMEFDWKRRPHAAGDVPVRFGDQPDTSHLAFSTKPWDSVAQFNTVRELWRAYTKDTPRCLKSLDDYQTWATFFESKLAAQGPAAAYLAKDDGIPKRIRRDLVIAQKLRKAGTHHLNPRAFDKDLLPDGVKLKAQDFANILNDRFGIPCSKMDVDNARKKKAFLPNQVPNCAQAIEILVAIKRDLFPELDIQQFLTPKAAFDIQVVERDMSKPQRE